MSSIYGQLGAQAAYGQGILTYPFPAPIQGLNIELPPDEIPPTYITDGQNMIYRRGQFKTRRGCSTFGTAAPGSPIRGFAFMGPTLQSGAGSAGPLSNDVLLAAGDSSWYKISIGGVWSSLSGYSPSACDHTIFRIFPNASSPIIGTNYVDVPHTWDGSSGTAAALGGSPAVAKCMMVLANRLILFNLKTASGYTGPTGGTAFDVSAPNDPTSGWSSTLNGFIRDTKGDIVAALEASDLQGYVYKTDGIAAMTASASIDPFTVELIAANIIGPANPRCVCALPDGRHAYLGADYQIYTFDGASRPTPLHASVQKHIAAKADTDLTQLKKALLWYDPNYQELVCHFKGRGVNVIRGVRIALSNLSLWPITMAIGTADITAAGMAVIPSNNMQQPVYFYGSSGQGYRENAGDTTDGGNAITFGWNTPLTDFGITDKWKTLGHLEHTIYAGTDDPDDGGGGSQTCYVDILEEANAAVGIGDLNTFTFASGDAGDLVYATDHRASGRKLGLEYSFSGTGSFHYAGGTARLAIGGAR